MKQCNRHMVNAHFFLNAKAYLRKKCDDGGKQLLVAGVQCVFFVHLSHRTTDCFDDRLPFRRQMPINLEGEV